MATISRFSINRKGRDLAVGDMHAHFSRLERALIAAHFYPQVDRLFSVGDLDDRGPEPERALTNVYHIDTAGWMPDGYFTLFDLDMLAPVMQGRDARISSLF